MTVVFEVNTPGERNSDWNDIELELNDPESLAELWNASKRASTQSVNDLSTPLPYFVDEVTAPEFVIDRVIQTGVVVIAGSPGTGKSSCMLPLMCKAAHLCAEDDPLRPLLRRNVAWISEDPDQAKRIMASLRASGSLDGFSAHEIAQRVMIFGAKRLVGPGLAARIGAIASRTVENQCPDTGTKINVAPVIVLDTGSANMAVANESDNAEIADAIATLKRECAGVPIVIIGHVAKALKRADAADQSMRGAGAWEGDAHQVAYLVRDTDGTNWLDISTPKHRFDGAVDGVRFQLSSHQVTAVDVFGRRIKTLASHCVPRLVEAGERKALKARQERAAQAAEELVRKAKVLEAVRVTIRDEGSYATHNEILSLVRGRRESLAPLLERMVADGSLVLQNLAANVRRNNSHQRGYVLPPNRDTTDEAYRRATQGD